MNHVYTSDENSGTKLIAVAADDRDDDNQGMDNPGSMSNDIENVSSTNQSIQRQTGSERSPLIRPRRSTDLTEDTSGPENSDHVSLLRSPRYGSINSRGPSPMNEPQDNLGCFEKVKKFLIKPENSVIWLLLIIIFDIVLVFAANLNTDEKGMQVKPKHVKIYLMVLIAIFIGSIYVTIIRHNKEYYYDKPRGTIIPSPLLTGVGIFGTVSATTHILVFLDFIKCSQHIDGLSYVYAVYPFFKIAFIYFQIYFFYKLSRDGIRHVDFPGSALFVMVTLATNLCIWFSVFIDDASDNPKLRSISWLNHYYYGIEGSDLCANESLTSQASRDMHSLVDSFSPYISTFSMEYTLLASGLLLHIWRVIKGRSSYKKKKPKQPWTLWRFGFILGLLAIPVVFVVYMKEQITIKIIAPKVMLYVLKAGYFIVLMIFCFFCIKKVNTKLGFVEKKKAMKLEVFLLGISGFLGFPAYDLSCVFAAICEWRNFHIIEIIWYGICALCELVAVGVQFYFIKKAYQHKLPPVPSVKVGRAAQVIRQYASFALVVNIAYWAAKTYELRRTSADPSIAETFFGKYTWFVVSHFSFPLCIFFYFHLAICYANVVSSFSQFGPLWSPEVEKDD